MNRLISVLRWVVLATVGPALIGFLQAPSAGAEPPEGSSELLAELVNYQHKIVYETNRDGNWELYVCNADGTNPVNLTRTPDVDELYPKPSPDGTKICFVADIGSGDARVRNIYYMNSDGTGRTKVADNGREPCWSPDETRIAYMKGEFEKFTYLDAATKGLFLYDLATAGTREHVNPKLHHLYTLNCSPDGRWFVATVHGGMGFSHTILAIEADGDKVVDLKLKGCRPNISPDGKKLCWGHGDYCAGVADLDLSGSTPSAINQTDMVESQNPIETYHITWSPDMKYLTFTRGPKFKGKNLKGLLPEFPGVEAPGWNVCVADATQKNRWVAITSDGKSCKQPSWVKVKQGGAMTSRRIRLAGCLIFAALGPLGCQRPDASPSVGGLPTFTSPGGEMVLIPAGSFEMGSRHGREEEKPVHQVEIGAFLMDRHEVTQAEYERIGKIEAFPNPSHFQGPDLPAEQVTWPQAARYCNARSRLEALEPCYNEDTGVCDFQASGYRLPTEAEWEYACRAGTSSDYSCGSESRQLADFAWFADNSSKKTHPVGRKKPNPWGLFDMHGNVAEWCHDVYDPGYYKASSVQDPRGPESGNENVLRGGSWKSPADALRSAYRIGENPGFSDACLARDAIGFRCVRKPPPSKDAG